MPKDIKVPPTARPDQVFAFFQATYDANPTNSTFRVEIGVFTLLLKQMKDEKNPWEATVAKVREWSVVRAGKTPEQAVTALAKATFDISQKQQEEEDKKANNG